MTAPGQASTSLFSLSEKVAIVTGAASGIGRAIARRLASAGAHVVVADLQDGTSVADEINGTYSMVDVSVETQVADLMRRVSKDIGPPNVIVNNAGIMAGGDVIEREPAQAYLRQFEVNAMGVVYGIKHGAPQMPRGGSIVNTASIAAVIGMSGIASYSMSKWSVIGITKSAAVELAHRAIRVNCVCPGTTDTSLGRNTEEDVWTSTASLVGRIAQPEEIAAVVHFLASPDASYVTGQALMVDGGLTVGLNPQLSAALLRDHEVSNP